MKGAMKANKELDLNFIDKLQDELADMSVRGGGGGGGGAESSTCAFSRRACSGARGVSCAFARMPPAARRASGPQARPPTLAPPPPAPLRT